MNLRDIDYNVAEYVMGLIPIRDEEHYYEVQESDGDFFGEKYFCTTLLWNKFFDNPRSEHTIPLAKNYSTNIADAMEIVKRLHVTPFIMEKLAMYKGLDYAWNVNFVYKGTPFSGYAETLPLAICNAALAVSKKHGVLE